MLEGYRKGLAQTRFDRRFDHHIGNRQLDAVLAESIQTRPVRGGDEHPIHAQVRVTVTGGPLGQVGVDALAVGHQGCQQTYMLTAIVAQDAGCDRIEALRFNGCAIPGAVLNAQLHVEQSQEVVDLGERGHGALAATTTRALFDRHRWRDAEDRIGIGARGRLHELARVSIERFEVTPLPFAKDDVESQR